MKASALSTVQQCLRPCRTKSQEFDPVHAEVIGNIHIDFNVATGILG